MHVIDYVHGIFISGGFNIQFTGATSEIEEILSDGDNEADAILI